MAKRSIYDDNSERVKVEDDLDEEFDDEEVDFEELLDVEELPKQPETVRLVLLKDMKLNYTGPVTGKLYMFDKAGAEIDVDKEDANEMLAKKGGSCCPGSGIGLPQPYFAIVNKEG